MTGFNKIRLDKRILILSIIVVSVPSLILGDLFFTYVEKNIIETERRGMEHLLMQQQIQITKNIESIEAVVGFFTTDNSLVDFLEKHSNQELTEEEKAERSDKGLYALDRMVQNNAYINRIRIYLMEDSTRERPPAIYQLRSMEKLEWASEENIIGWHTGYKDVLSENKEDEMVGYVAEVRRADGTQRTAIMEAAMRMENLFPDLNKEVIDRAYWFIDKKGRQYGDIEVDRVNELIHAVEILQVESNIGSFYQVDKDRNFVVGYLYIDELDGLLVSALEITALIKNAEHSRGIFYLCIIIACGIFGMAISLITKRMFKRFYDVLHSIQEIQKGNLEIVIDEKGEDEVSELGSQINKMTYQIKMLMEENIHRGVLTKKAEIKALQNQINAHFIYNVLESIKMMAEIEEEYDISDAITVLGKLLRYTMRWESGDITVREEIEYIRNYLKLINIRFDYKIDLSVNMEGATLNQTLPKMSLQPLVENAIYHGIEELGRDSTIYINGYVEESAIIIEVIDVGKGMSGHMVKEIQERLSAKIESIDENDKGVGLKNVQDRIRMKFGEAYGLEIRSSENNYTKVKIKVPITKQ